MYIGLAQVISKAFVNKPMSKYADVNLNKYIYARLHSLQSCIITAIKCWGDIIIGLIATLNTFISNLILQGKTPFYDLKMYV